ncbi:MAG: hypothetical protein CM1200mP30_20980 [Pseudomonadota bacterium]|nr:MAG: hypothetical protein CM1200mP30_20980 [Pseudomonadota bacterium]
MDSGINDWGGISPLTPDHVNPEAPWPEIASLAESMEKCGKVLTERLPFFRNMLSIQGIGLTLKQILISLNQWTSKAMQEKIVGLQVNLLCFPFSISIKVC